MYNWDKSGNKKVHEWYHWKYVSNDILHMHGHREKYDNKLSGPFFLATNSKHCDNIKIDNKNKLWTSVKINQCTCMTDKEKM